MAAGGAITDIVTHSYNGFPVSDVREFLEFARALIASGPDAPTPTALENFLGTHPNARKFVETPKPTPASFANESFYGVDAFRFVNRDGAARLARYQILPAAGAQY